MAHPLQRTSRAALVEMLEEGLSVSEMAQALRCTTRTIDRALVRYGLREPVVANHLKPHEIERARMLAEEGMPMSWIAEDLNRDRNSLTRQVSPSEENIAEWRRVWQEIRRNETLFALHHDFYPRERASA